MEDKYRPIDFTPATVTGRWKVLALAWSFAALFALWAAEDVRNWLVWDEDIQPEGAALRYRFDFIPETWWTEVNLGFLVLEEVGQVNLTQTAPGLATTTLPDNDDRDPFVLFSMRGLTRKELQAELLKSPLGRALAASLNPDLPEPVPAESLHTRPTKRPVDATVGHRAFWAGARRLPPAEPVPQVRVPALVVKKQGDYPPFWKKDGSFIEVMEELYERVRSKSPQMK